MMHMSLMFSSPSPPILTSVSYDTRPISAPAHHGCTLYVHGVCVCVCVCEVHQPKGIVDWVDGQRWTEIWFLPNQPPAP